MFVGIFHENKMINVPVEFEKYHGINFYSMMFYEIVRRIILKCSRIIQLLYATNKMYQDEKVISSDGQIFVEFRGTSQTSTTVRSIIRQRPQVAG